MPVAALVALALAATPAPARYEFLSGGQVVGALVRTTAPDGAVKIEFQYLENGRGPKLVEHLRRDARGREIAHELTGTSTMGAAVAERFVREGGRASWKTTADEGSAPDAGAAVYLPLVPTPESYAAIVRAALANGGRVRLLPDGEARVKRVAAGDLAVPGRRPPAISLYAITGLELSPHFVWLDRSGALFADLYPTTPPFGLVAHGWADQAGVLVRRQKQAEDELLAALAKETRHRVDGPLAIRDVRPFDPVAGRLGPPSTVYVFRGRVSTVAPAADPIPDDTWVVEGGGKVLLPALVDMHGHEWTWNAALQLAGGVTTVRDLANNEPELLELEDHVRDGRWIGPRLWRAGFVEGASPFASRGSGNVAETLEAALAIVDQHARRGYRGVKLYNSIKPEWMAPLAARARALGLRVSGHVPAFTRARDAILAGYQEIHHVNQLLLNFVAKDGEDTRTLARFTAYGERAGALDLDGPEFQAFVRLMKERDVTHDPTLAVFEDLLCQAPGELSRTFGPVADHLPAVQRRQLRMASMEADGPTRARYRAAFERSLEVVARLDRAGVTIVPGTDNVAGFTLHRELELWARAGIPPARVLAHATAGAARVLGLDGELGRIAPGFSADLALVDGDPTADVSALRRVAMVVKEGDLYFPAEIYPHLGVRPFVEAPRLAPPRGRSGVTARTGP